GNFGVDVVVGTTQRFGIPLGYGGPHAAFFATKDEYKRSVPGRIIGVSKDTDGNRALRMALQTREQHIKRDRATSNICTAQVLLANMAGMYAVYHGPEGLKNIATNVHHLTALTAEGLRRLGCQLDSNAFFDTLRVRCPHLSPAQIIKKGQQSFINLRQFPDGSFGIALDEATTITDVSQLLTLFTENPSLPFSLNDLTEQLGSSIPNTFQRHSPFLTHPVFHDYHSEHELLRYMYRLQSKDLSLV